MVIIIWPIYYANLFIGQFVRKVADASANRLDLWLDG